RLRSRRSVTRARTTSAHPSGVSRSAAVHPDGKRSHQHLCYRCGVFADLGRITHPPTSPTSAGSPRPRQDHRSPVTNSLDRTHRAPLVDEAVTVVVLAVAHFVFWGALDATLVDLAITVVVDVVADLEERPTLVVAALVDE